MDEKELKDRTKEFAHQCVKLALALPKGQLGNHEAAFWLEFIIDENLLKSNQVVPLQKEAQELTAIFYSSRKTARKKV